MSNWILWSLFEKKYAENIYAFFIILPQMYFSGISTLKLTV